MDANLDRGNLRREMEAAIPETRDGSVALVSFDQEADEPLHATVGIAMSERFVRHLANSASSAVVLVEYATFLDRMFLSDDEYVQDVATTGVVERIVGSTPDAEVARVRRHLGPLAQIAFDRAIATRKSVQDRR
jgi:hypothetical protein